MTKTTRARHALLAVAVLTAAASVAGERSVSQEQAAQPSAAKVTIDNFQFAPAELTVKVGTTVTWTNRDDMPHTVVSTAKTFASKVLDTDETFTYTFDKAGTFEYFCSIHPRMTGRVIVQAR